jgi:hypothetical protein
VTYALIDDGMDFHRKVVAAGNAAFGAWVRMLCYSRRLRTDGVVTKGVARAIASSSELKRLTSAGVRLLDEEGDDYRIHDFLAWNMSAEQLDAKREATADARSDRARAAATKRWGAGRNATPPTAKPANGNGKPDMPSDAQASTEHASRMGQACAKHDAADATAMLGDAPSPSPSPSPKDPPVAPQGGPTKRPRSAHKVACPPRGTPEPDLHAWLDAAGLGEVRASRSKAFELGKFLDHHRAKGSRFKDWKQAFDNWESGRFIGGPLPAQRELIPVESTPTDRARGQAALEAVIAAKRARLAEPVDASADAPTSDDGAADHPTPPCPQSVAAIGNPDSESRVAS